VSCDPDTCQFQVSQNILCPGLQEYCDCGDDCTNKPEWCECEDAQKCCGTFDSDSDSDDGEWPDSPFEVFDVDLSEGGCDVPNNKAKKMKKAGFIKVACPFGVLIAGTEEYNDEFLLFGANVLANILDQDSDGIADDPAVIKKLTYKKGKKKGALLACGISEEQESRGEELRDDVFDYAFSCQTWRGWDVARKVKGIMMEEAFHLVHQNGYAVVYPDELGMNDFTSSVVSRETARLQCVEPGWFHHENECPSDSPRPPGDPASSPLEGTCNEPSCDVAEFYKMALFLAIGMGPTNDPSGPIVWTSDYMPTAQDKVLEMLSDKFKDMIANPDLHQLTAPITGEYCVANCEDSH